MNQQEQLEYYDNQTDDYEKAGLLKRGLTRAYKRNASIIYQEVAKLSAKRILEVGSGTGLMTFYLSKLFSGELMALDLSEAMLTIAKNRIQNHNVSYTVGDAACPDFPAEYFDAVVGVDIIHHLDKPIDAFSAWRRIVKPGGKMVFLETNIYNPINLRNIGVEHEVRAFLNTDNNLARWSEKAGWDDVSVKPAPAYTPSGPRFLAPMFDLIDEFSTRIPLWRKLTALWLVSNTKKS